MKRLVLFVGLMLMFAVSASAQGFGDTEQVEAFIEGRMVVRGMSAPNKTKFAAEHAARADAQAKMLAAIEGVYLKSEGLFKEGETVALVTTTSVQGQLKGARQCYRTKAQFEQVQVDGQLKYVAEYCLEMPMRGRDSVYSIVYPALKEKQGDLRVDEKPMYDVQQAVAKMPDAAPAAKPAPAADYDGVIVDVRELRFYPDLANRILTDNNEVLFGPSSVLQEWLIDRGCGAYYTEESRARAQLKRWGSKNPLVVEALDMSGNSDVVISTEQAQVIAASNTKTSFLPAARVIFLLR